jgi:hypothetical protein
MSSLGQATAADLWVRAGATLNRLASALCGRARTNWERRSEAPRPPARDLAARVLLLVLGVCLAYRAGEATSMAFREPVNYYDEGIVLTGANQLLWGKVPYRDFYSNYPPGVFLLVLGAFRVVGTSVAAERAIGFALHLAVALGAGRLGGRLSGEKLAWMPVALVLTWLLPLRAGASAWLAALAVALWACELGAWASARGGRLRFGLAGAALGAVSWFRHDLFVYFALSLCALAALRLAGAALRKERAPAAAVAPATPAAMVALGALLSLAVMWIPVLARAGLRQTLADLVLDQVRYVAPARELPVPALLSLGRVSWSPVALPAFVRQVHEGALALTLAGPVLALAALARRAKLVRRADAVWLAALCTAVLPQALGRADVHHAVYAVSPSLVASWFWVQWAARRAGQPGALARSVAGAVLLFTPAPALPTPTLATPLPARMRVAADLLTSPEQRLVVSFIESHGQRGEPLYVGLTDHRWISVNEMDLYFLSNRVGATRYMQFEPQVINRADVQEAMIRELERSRPRVAVLSKRSQRMGEPNTSEQMGASLLDEYLSARYQPVLELSEYRLALRR